MQEEVNGRNAISWEDKFKYDVEYVDNVTFLGDWKIIFQTVWNVLKRDGINSEKVAIIGNSTESTLNKLNNSYEIFNNWRYCRNSRCGVYKETS